MGIPAERLDDDLETGEPSRSRVYVVVLPLARVAFAAAATVAIAAAGVGGYWARVGTDRLLALVTPGPGGGAAEVTLDLAELIVNMSGEAPGHYIKLGVTLAFAAADRPMVEQGMPRLIDAEQDFLRNLDSHDLKGSAGLARLRFELKRRFNLILGKEAVHDVLLRSLLTQ